MYSKNRQTATNTIFIYKFLRYYRASYEKRPVTAWRSIMIIWTFTNSSSLHWAEAACVTVSDCRMTVVVDDETSRQQLMQLRTILATLCTIVTMVASLTRSAKSIRDSHSKPRTMDMSSLLYMCLIIPLAISICWRAATLSRIPSSRTAFSFPIAATYTLPGKVLPPLYWGA